RTARAAAPAGGRVPGSPRTAPRCAEGSGEFQGVPDLGLIPLGLANEEVGPHAGCGRAASVDSVHGSSAPFQLVAVPRESWTDSPGSSMSPHCTPHVSTCQVTLVEDNYCVGVNSVVI